MLGFSWQVSMKAVMWIRKHGTVQNPRQPVGGGVSLDVLEWVAIVFDIAQEVKKLHVLLSNYMLPQHTCITSGRGTM